MCVPQGLLSALGVPDSFPDADPQRAIYCSRTLNLRSIKAIGECAPRACHLPHTLVMVVVIVMVMMILLPS